MKVAVTPIGRALGKILPNALTIRKLESNYNTAMPSQCGWSTDHMSPGGVRTTSTLDVGSGRCDNINSSCVKKLQIDCR